MTKPIGVWIAQDVVERSLVGSVIPDLMTTFGDPDEAIEFIAANTDSICFVGLDARSIASSRVVEAWVALRSRKRSSLGGRPGDFYSHVVDAFTPEAACLFTASSPSAYMDHQLAHDWAALDHSRFGFFPKPFDLSDIDALVRKSQKRWQDSRVDPKPPSAECRAFNATSEELAALCAVRHGYIDALTPRQFEEVIAAILRNNGFDVHLTACSRDGGYDVAFVTGSQLNSRITLIEVKHFAPGRPVGVGIVRALYGVKCLKNAGKAFLVTSSYVSNDAKREFSRVVPWEIDFIERPAVEQLLNEYLATLSHAAHENSHKTL